MADAAPVRRSAIGGPGSLVILALVGFAYRVAYVLGQARHDPWFAHPMLDAAYYLDWARALLSGSGGPEGAYYLAPLYAHGLAAYLAVFGDGLAWLYLLQHLLAVLAALAIATLPGPPEQRTGNYFAAALFLFHHPLVFFASRPLGEIVGIALLLLALWAVRASRGWSAPAAGLALGLACLARPNLLLVVAGWTAVEAVSRRWRRAAGVLLGAALVILPVTVRNLAVSGHPVPISSNGGITAYHGNGPGATGGYAHPDGFRPGMEHQREDATRLATAAAGRPLDAVEADRWWGRRALRTRLDDPAGTVRLLARRLAMTIDNHEQGLDYSPMLDANPLRATLRLGGGREIAWIPFAALFGLAGGALLARGVRGSGGAHLWVAVAACAAVPVMFYVSSRYRLPMVALATIPAGQGLAALIDRREAIPRARRLAAGVTAAALCVLSLALPSGTTAVRARAEGLANRALAWLDAGRPDEARRDVDEAADLAPDVARIRFNRGVVLERQGLTDEAEQAYRTAFRLDPSLVEAAGNLSGLLLKRGAWAESATLLEHALARREDCATCWNNLALARYALGDVDGVRRVVARAAAAGVALDPAMVQALTGSPRATGGSEE